jgi:hypothetical protein
MRSEFLELSVSTRTMWQDFIKHRLTRVDSSRHGYLLYTLGQDCMSNSLEFRIILRPTKALCHFCIGVGASTYGTNIFQHRRNYISHACGAALTSQNSAGDPSCISTLVNSTTHIFGRFAGRCCHSCPDAVLITTSCCRLPRRRGCETGLSLATLSESGVETDLFGGTSVALI